jgi:hypothetical protein
VKRRIVLLWLAAMLLAMVVAMWPARSRRSIDPVRLGVVVDGGIEEHPPALVTTIEDTRIVRRGALVEIGGQQVEPTQRRRVREVPRTARGPPGVSVVGDVRE